MHEPEDVPMPNPLEMAEIPNYLGMQYEKGLATMTESAIGGNLHRPTVMKQVEVNITETKNRLAQLEKVREILTKNPEIHDLLTLMRRVGL